MQCATYLSPDYVMLGQDRKKLSTTHDRLSQPSTRRAITVVFPTTGMAALKNPGPNFSPAYSISNLVVSSPSCKARKTPPQLSDGLYAATPGQKRTSGRAGVNDHQATFPDGTKAINARSELVDIVRGSVR